MLVQVKDMLRYNLVVRILAMPMVKLRNRRCKKEYDNGGYGKEIQDYENLYSGKRCFVIGNGPSLCYEDLEKLENEITFASNRIYRLYPGTFWRPDFYVAFEPEFVCMNIDEIIDVDVKTTRFINFRGRSVCSNMMYADKQVIWLNCFRDFMLKKTNTNNIVFSADVSKIVYDAYSVTYTMLQIAVYMGFKEIYLLGMDHNKEDAATRHFYDEKKTDFRTNTYWEGIEAGYQKAKDYADAHDIHIYNATRGGKLEVFPRIDFDSLFANQ